METQNYSLHNLISDGIEYPEISIEQIWLEM